MILSTRRKLRTLHQDLANAPDYDQWSQIAAHLDDVEGNDVWREDPFSPHYDHQLIKTHIDAMRRARREGDARALTRLIEESLHRNLGDISNQALYEYAYTGPKHLIETYMSELEQSFKWLLDASIDGYTDAMKLKRALEAERVFGRSALILSGGGALGLFHLGVVKALWRESMLPSIISGASMGAIVAGGVCTRDDSELEAFWSDLSPVHRRAAKLQGPSGWWKSGSLLSPQQLREHVRANMRDETFAESWARTGRALNVAVSPTRHRQKPRLLSHVTSPDVLIQWAVVASCSIPSLFPSSQLKRRGRLGREEPYIEGEKWIDGSIHGDVPMMRLSRLYNVNHHIVSQANPHVLPFAKMEGAKGMVPAAMDIATGTIRAQSKQMINLARRRFAGSALSPGLELAHAIAHQNYTGNINIHPTLKAADYLKLMSNPSLAQLQQYVLSGERATWPKMALIRDQTRIARALRSTIKALQARIEAQEPGTT